MKANDRLHVSQFLKDLNVRYSSIPSNACYIYDCTYKSCCRPITCAELAEKCGVTPATISNLNTDSKFSLLFAVAGEIYDAYYGLFQYEESLDRKEHPDEIISIRDHHYVLMNLVSYYSDEFLSY